MAPKKDTGAPQADLNPFGAFLNVTVSHAELKLLLPTEQPAVAKTAKTAGGKAAEPAGPPGPPKTHLVLSYPGTYAPVTGTPTDAVAEGSYNYAFIGRSRREPTMDAMHELIDGAVTISVWDTTQNVLLASASVDVLEFGMGANTIDLGSVALAPELAVPAGCAKVLSGELYGVRIWLTYRPPTAYTPESIAIGGEGSRPGTGASQRPKGSGKAGADATTHPPESELPPPQPFSFIRPDEQQGCNVLELSLGSITSLPPGLAPAVTAATEGKAGGKVSFVCAAVLPAGPQVAVMGSLLTGTETGNMIAFQPGRKRCFMTQGQVTALLDALEDGLPLNLEIARYLTSEVLSDNAWDAYHASAQLPDASVLLTPGTTAVAATTPAPLVPFTTPSATVLLPYQAPQGKTVKVMEEPPGPPGTCAWTTAESVLNELGLRFARPLIPPWAPPPAPATALVDLVPARPGLVPHAPQGVAMARFRKQAAAMAQALTQLQLSGAAANVSQLADHLAADGRLQQLRAELKQHIVAVALETLRTDLDGHRLTPDQTAEALRQVHSVLAQSLTSVLSELSGGAADGQAAQATTGRAWRLQQLLDAANECEVVGAVQRAAELHQQRVLLCVGGAEDDEPGADIEERLEVVSASIWRDYAGYCLRQGHEHQGRAEQALRRALRSLSTHQPSLAALSCLLLQQGHATDTLYLSEAARAAQQLVAMSQDQAGQGSSLAWGLLLLICQAAGDSAKQQDMAAALAALQQAEVAGLTEASPDDATSDQAAAASLRAGVDPTDANGLLAVAELAADLALPDVALEALKQAIEELPSSCSVPAIAARMDLAAAHAWAWRHTSAHARAHTAQATAVEAANAAARAAEHLVTTSAAEPSEGGMTALAEAQQAAQQAAEKAVEAATAAEQAVAASETALSQVLAYCMKAQAGLGDGDSRPHILEGQTLYQAGQWRACAAAYVKALPVLGRSVRQPLPLRAYVQLADSYMKLDQAGLAGNVYMQACVSCPCSTTWLGLARAQAAEGDEVGAQAALTQAASCDPESALVWAYLALAAIRGGRTDEAKVHITTALKLGLADLALLTELAGQGTTATAAGLSAPTLRAVLERAVHQPKVPVDLRLRLIEICLDQGDGVTARIQMEAALSEAAGQEEVEARVNALLPRMFELQARTLL